MATLKPVQTDKYGLAKVSDGRYVNPNYATPESQAAMLRNANPQGFSPYTTKDAQGNDIRVNPINQAVGFSGYGFSGEGGVSNVNSIQGLNLQIPTTISSSVLANNEAPIQIPQTPFSTQADRITGRTNAILQSDDLEQKAEQQRLEQQSKLQSTEQKQQSLLQRIGLVKQEETKKGNEEFGLDLLKEKRKNAVKGMRESIIRQQEEFAAVEKESMLTDVQKSQRRSAIRQKYALEQNQLQLDYDLSNMDIVAAQATIDDRIKILTEPMYAELELTQNVYNQISQSLSKAEDRVWNIAINNIENAVAEKNKIGEFAKQVAANGADAGTISRVSSAKTMAEAVQAAGQYSGDILDREYKKAQIANINSQIAERNSQGTGIESSNLLAYAQQYASTGVIPTGLPKGTFGAVAQTAKELPKPNGAVVNTTTGIADSKTPATEQADYARLYNIINNVKRLKQLDEERIGGIVSGTLGKIFGAEKQSEYLATRKAIVDDMQRMQSGAALTPAEISFYEGYLPGRFSEPLGLGQDSAKKISNFETIMTNRLNERLAANGLSIYGYSKVNTPIGEFTVGDVIEVNGVMGRINPDGSVTKLSQ